MTVNIRTPVTLVVLIALLVVGLLVGWRLATADAPSLRDSTGTNDRSCQKQEFEAGSTLRAPQVTVNVLNSGTTPNLAGDTMRALTRRGFEGGTTGNAPDGVRAASVLILDPNPDYTDVRLVAKQFGRGLQIKKPSRDNDPFAVDIIVGNDFRASEIDDNAPTVMKVKEGYDRRRCPAPPDADD
jgi:hypothetical protein